GATVHSSRRRKCRERGEIQSAKLALECFAALVAQLRVHEPEVDWVQGVSEAKILRAAIGKGINRAATLRIGAGIVPALIEFAIIIARPIVHPPMSRVGILLAKQDSNSGHWWMDYWPGDDY